MRTKALLLAMGIAVTASQVEAAVTYTSHSVTHTASFSMPPAYPPFPIFAGTDYVVFPKINLGALDVLDSVSIYGLFHSDQFFSVYNNTPSYQLDAASYNVIGMTWNIKADLPGAPVFKTMQGRPSNYSTFGGIGLDPNMWLHLPVMDHFDVVAGGTLDPSFNAGFVGTGSNMIDLFTNFGVKGGSGFVSMHWMNNLSTTGDAFIRYDYRIGTETGPTDVPEPMTLSVLGMGLMGLGLARPLRGPTSAGGRASR